MLHNLNMMTVLTICCLQDHHVMFVHLLAICFAQSYVHASKRQSYHRSFVSYNTDVTKQNKLSFFLSSMQMRFDALNKRTASRIPRTKSHTAFNQFIFLFHVHDLSSYLLSALILCLMDRVLSHACVLSHFVIYYLSLNVYRNIMVKNKAWKEVDCCVYVASTVRLLCLSYPGIKLVQVEWRLMTDVIVH